MDDDSSLKKLRQSRVFFLTCQAQQGVTLQERSEGHASCNPWIILMQKSPLIKNAGFFKNPFCR
jgi:hypothetical protein